MNRKDAMSWHVYEVLPIDFNWDYLPTVEETAVILASQEAQALVREGDTSSIPGMDSSRFLDLWRSAQEAARMEGWGGDHRELPVVMWLPTEAEFQAGFVIKQDNNGTTYVVSPVPLAYLED